MGIRISKLPEFLSMKCKGDRRARQVHSKTSSLDGEYFLKGLSHCSTKPGFWGQSHQPLSDFLLFEKKAIFLCKLDFWKILSTLCRCVTKDCFLLYMLLSENVSAAASSVD